MANVILGYPIVSDVNTVHAPALSGGAWTLPLANLQDRRLALVARSTSAQLKDTRFSIDLAAARRVGVLAIPKHTLSQSAKLRILGTNSDQFFSFYEAGEDIATKGGTFVRASIATCMDQRGIMFTVAAGELRDSHFIGGKRCVLLEGQRDNNALWSEDLTNGAWVMSNATAQANIGTAIDGSLTMDILTETVANAEHLTDQTRAGWANNAIVAQSVFIRPYAATGAPHTSNIKLSIVQKDGATVIGAIFNPTTGAVVSADAGIDTQVEFMANTQGITLCYRVSISGSVGTGAFDPRMRMQTANGGATVYAGNVLCGVAVWGMQWEAGSFSSSYIKTTNAAVTRNADLLTFPAAGVQPGVAWTSYLRGIALAVRDGADYFCSIGTANPILQIACDNGAGNYITSRFTDVTPTTFDAPVANAPRFQDTFEIASQWVSNGAASTLTSKYSLNGGAVVSATSPNFTAPGAWGGANIITLTGAAGNEGYYALQSFRVVPGTATLATMQASLYDSGWLDVWPVVYPPGSLPADDPRMADGKYSAEEAAELGIGFTLVISPAQLWKYCNVQISDSGNAASCVDLARLAICGAIQPTLNFIEGAKIGLSTASTREESDGGAAIFDEKPIRRDVAFTLEGPEDELLVTTFELKRRAGITKQLMFVYDGADTYHMTRRSFLGVLKQLDPLDAPYTKRGSSAYAVIEEL